MSTHQCDQDCEPVTDATQAVVDAAVRLATWHRDTWDTGRRLAAGDFTARWPQQRDQYAAIRALVAAVDALEGGAGS